MATAQISAVTKKRLRLLADKYETCTFSNGDPSCILQKYHAIADKEVAAFVVALLSFGRRDLFMKKADAIFALAGKQPAVWIKSGDWQNDFPRGSKKFYRFYSYDDMRAVFAVLQTILAKEKTFGAYVRKLYEAAIVCSANATAAVDMNGAMSEPVIAACTAKTAVVTCVSRETVSVDASKATHAAAVADMNRTARIAQSADSSDCCENTPHLSEIISCIFSGCRAVPQAAESANKRIHMFLRWMVRTNSPVDVGLWTWYSPADLIIPLDVHVLRQAIKLNLVPPKSSASAKTARQLTAVLKQIWPDDPCRGDFALFGLGIDAQGIGGAPACVVRRLPDVR
ncbi:MAG: TIGR02757 family protein [Treponema sp.]|nr:TIGR02757 family protein [Treponema sp.]